jgi:hypothetical protein
MINLKAISIFGAVALSIGLASGIKIGLWWQQDTIDDLNQKHNEQIQSIEAAAERDLKERQDQINNLQREFAIADQNYFEVLKNAQTEIAKRDADLRALRSVSTVKVKSCVPSANGKRGDSKTPDGPSRAELDPEAAIRIYGITDDGDAAIRQLAELQGVVKKLTAVCPIEII